MSTNDGTNFEDLFPGFAEGESSTPAPAPEPAPVPAPTASSDDIAALRQQNLVLEQRQKDMARALLGEKPPDGPAVITDPIAFANYVQQKAQEVSSQTAVNAVVQQMTIQAEVTQLRTENPHLVPFEGAIRTRADQLYAQEVAQNKQPNVTQVMKQAVAEFDKSYKDSLNASQAQRNADAIKANSLPFANTQAPNGQAPIRNATEALAFANQNIDKNFPMLEKAVKEGRVKF